jgi:protein-S-isoprenylcysteine O-methyltransferase Ste14
MTLIKSILHNIGVVIVGFIVALISIGIDRLLGLHAFHSLSLFVIGWIALAVGFLIRVWATWYFYKARMNVIELAPQGTLITSGPYKFSRNPLYLGGNVFIFFGAVFVLGSVSGIVITILGIIFSDIMIRREERQLDQKFGEEWRNYKKGVRRWI